MGGHSTEITVAPPNHAQHHDKIFDDDAQALAAIGKTQAFHRRFNFWTVLGITVCVSGTWEGISASVLQALTSGGSVALLYGYLLTCVGVLCVAASMSELASVWPSSGAQYHWAAELSPKRFRPVISWYAGWFSYSCCWLGICSCMFGVGVQIQAYAIVGAESYVEARWHVFLVMLQCTLLIILYVSMTYSHRQIYMLSLTVAMLVNIFGVTIMHKVNVTGIVGHVVFYFITLITLAVCTKDKHDATYVFTNFTNYSGWESPGIAFCIGLLTSAYGFIGIETAAHFAEEMKHVARDLPRAIFGSVAVNCVVTLPWLIALLYCMGDLDAVLNGPIGFTSPVTQIYINSTGNIGFGIFLNSLTTCMAFLAGTDLVGSAARTLWAMARDNALPKVLAEVHPKYDVPVWAIVATCLPLYFFGLIYIWNTTAFYGMMSAVMLMYQLSYCLPIALHLFYGRRHMDIKYGPWCNGRLGPIVDAVSVIWTTFLFIFMCFPLYYPVTDANMNYAVAFFGAIMVLATAGWFGYGRSRFHGPIIEVPYLPMVTEGLDQTVSASSKSEKANEVAI